MYFLLHVLFCISTLFFGANASASKQQKDGPIEHIVVLMMENRAFDHMLGHLKNVDGCTDAHCSNPTNPMDPKSPQVPLSFDADVLVDVDPPHQISAIEVQLWGSEHQIYPATMTGFIKASNNTRVMKAYNDTTLPVLSALAREFTLFDAMFSSVPGSTGPNRMYVHSATSHGAAHNIDKQQAEGYPQKTIFGDVLDSGKSWEVYYEDFPVTLELSRLRLHPTRFHHMRKFFEKAREGRLASYSFLEPRWGDDFFRHGSTQHPIQSVYYGELLIKQVYEAMRASPQWNSSALIVTYDEHGGFFDHVVPPFSGRVPNPDGLNSTQPGFQFNFTRLGCRVPFVVASPWVSKGRVVHSAPNTAYEHSSVIKTIRRWLNLSVQRPLTKREAWADGFEHILNENIRTDAPLKLPEAYKGNTPAHPDLQAKLCDLQVQVVYGASRVAPHPGNPTLEQIQEMTQLQAAQFLRQQLVRWRAAH